MPRAQPGKQRPRRGPLNSVRRQHDARHIDNVSGCHCGAAPCSAQRDSAGAVDESALRSHEFRREVQPIFFLAAKRGLERAGRIKYIACSNGRRGRDAGKNDDADMKRGALRIHGGMGQVKCA